MIDLGRKKPDKPGKVGQFYLIILVADHMKVIIQSSSFALCPDGKEAPGPTGIQFLDQCDLILFYLASAEESEHSRKNLICIHNRESSK